LQYKLSSGIFTGLLIGLFFLGCRTNLYKQGHQIYRFNCEGCHMEDGSGLAKLIPSIRESDLFKGSPDRLICMIRHGIEKKNEIGPQMPGNDKLNEVELANLVNYLRNEYTFKPDAITPAEVETCLALCNRSEYQK